MSIKDLKRKIKAKERKIQHITDKIIARAKIIKELEDEINHIWV